MSTISLNCLVSGDGPNKIFTVKIPSNKNVSILKQMIKKKHIVFSDTPATDIQLFKVLLAPDEAHRATNPLQIKNAERLSSPLAKISVVFKDLPKDKVHVIALGPTGIGNLDEKYQHLVMTAHTKGTVTKKDLESSKILNVTDPCAIVSKVIELLRRPRHFDKNKAKKVRERAKILHDDSLKAGSADSDNAPSSVSSAARLTSPNNSRDSDVTMSAPGSEEISSHLPERTQPGNSSKPDGPPYACSEEEIVHIQTVALCDFSLKRDDESIELGNHFNEDYANASIFFFFSFGLRSRPFFSFRFSRHSWEFNIYILVKNTLYYYRPKSSFLLAYGGLPRFFVKVHSVGAEDDELCLMLQAAVVVRYANQHLDRYKEEKDFFVVVVYITEEGNAICRIVYQDKNSDQVNYKIIEELQLTDKLELFHLLNAMYNLVSWLEHESGEDPAQTQAQVSDLEAKLQDVKGASAWSPKSSQDSFTPPTQKSKGRGTDDFPGRVGDYDVVPPVQSFDMDDSDDEESHKPSNIRVVRKWSDRKLDIVMKRSTSSNERQILDYLQTLEPSPHIVPLFDSINDGTVMYYVFPRLRQVDLESIRYGVVKEPCQGLVNGVAYLHENGIAHLDLKLDNLLYDSTTGFLKIIDFDVSERVKDAEEEVEGFRGTVGWTAPEVGQEHGPTQRFSAIRADRWACGWILQQFFEAGCETEHRAYESLAEKLVVRDPRQRPSLVEWCKGPASQQAPPTQQLDARRKYTDDDCEVPMPPAKKMKIPSPQNMPVEAGTNQDTAI